MADPLATPIPVDGVAHRLDASVLLGNHLEYASGPVVHVSLRGSHLPLEPPHAPEANRFIEYVCWTSEVNRLARTLVQSKSDPIQIRLREGGQIRAVGKLFA